MTHVPFNRASYPASVFNELSSREFVRGGGGLAISRAEGRLQAASGGGEGYAHALLHGGVGNDGAAA